MKVEETVDDLLNNLNSLKNTLRSLLMKIETQHDTVDWPQLLDNFALCTSQLSVLHKAMKSEKHVNTNTVVLLPRVLSADIDPELLRLTEDRLGAFNHENVPQYLRTKLEPDAEKRKMEQTSRANILTVDNLQKQANQLNKIANNVIEHVSNARNSWDGEAQDKTMAQSFRADDTEAMLAAMMYGRGLIRDKK